MWKVIYKFRDLKDNDHIYEVGDTYPREGKKASRRRIAELSGNTNAIGTPLIEEVE